MREDTGQKLLLIYPALEDAWNFWRGGGAKQRAKGLSAHSANYLQLVVCSEVPVSDWRSLPSFQLPSFQLPFFQLQLSSLIPSVTAAAYLQAGARAL